MGAGRGTNMGNQRRKQNNKQNTKKIINILTALRGDTVCKEQVLLEKQTTQKTIQQNPKNFQRNKKKIKSIRAEVVLGLELEMFKKKVEYVFQQIEEKHTKKWKLED